MSYMTKFEKDCLIYAFLHEHKLDVGSYLSKIDDLQVTSRDDTGVGYYVNFEEREINSDDHICRVGDSVQIESNDIGSIGMVVYIINGKINSIEFFSYLDKPVNPNMTEYSLGYRE